MGEVPKFCFKKFSPLLLIPHGSQDEQIPIKEPSRFATIMYGDGAPTSPNQGDLFAPRHYL